MNIIFKYACVDGYKRGLAFALLAKNNSTDKAIGLSFYMLRLSNEAESNPFFLHREGLLFCVRYNPPIFNVGFNSSNII
jgi:hypothetical protein